jgi:hypothetical protein
MNRPIEDADGDEGGESSVSQGTSGDLKKGQQGSADSTNEALDAKVAETGVETKSTVEGSLSADADKKTGESTLSAFVRKKNVRQRGGKSRKTLRNRFEFRPFSQSFLQSKSPRSSGGHYQLKK